MYEAPCLFHDELLSVLDKQFAKQIEYGEGWINKNEVLSQFLSMFEQYRSPLINQSYVEEELFNYLKESGIEISDRVE